MNFPWQIDVADVIDVIVVSMLIYAGLIWFKKTRAFLVVVGIVFLGAVYAASRYFNLFLTTAVLQGFFGVLLIAIIIIFQEELRHFFERVGMWSLGRRGRIEAVPLQSAIVRTALDSARAKIGALIVMAGQDPIDRHLEGGTWLDGRVSESLLKSIFDSSSPGHDGAVVIKSGRVSRFAVHLPLSRDPQKLGGLGTRHSAALGLTERCDALCIVVSEERGVISIARDGELSRLGDTEMLGKILDDYMGEKFPHRSRRRATNIFRKNIGEKFIAIILSIGLWAIFSSESGIVQRDFAVPIEYSGIPSDLSIVRAAPHELIITLSGDDRSFKLFDSENLRATVDASESAEGAVKIPVRKSFLTKLPRNLSLDGIRPPEINLVLRKNTDKDSINRR